MKSALPIRGQQRSQFRPFSLSHKIIGSFVVVSLLVALTSGLSYFYLKRIDTSYGILLNHNSVILQQAGSIQTCTQLQNSLLFSYLVEPSKDKEQQLTAVNAKLAEQIQDLIALINYDPDSSDMRTMVESTETFARLTKKVTEYMNRNEAGLARAEALLWSLPVTDALSQSAAAIERDEKAAMGRSIDGNNRLVATTVQSLLSVSIAALLAAVVIGIVLSRMIVKPMRLLVQATSRIADCDLSVPDLHVSNHDEIGDAAAAFNQMKRNLQRIVGQAGLSAEQVAAAADTLRTHSGQVSESLEHITMTVRAISTGAQSQVESVQAGVAIMEQMSGAIHQIAETTRKVNETSTRALHSADVGREAISTAIGQMSSIHLTMRQLVVTVQSLGDYSEQIVQANGVIADIARKTNILALNASIEAVRAGQTGTGFVVIADEVRKLAKQTAAAADEVANLINGIQEEISSVVLSTEDGTREVSTGMTVVNLAEDAFRHIQAAVEEMSSQMLLVSGESEHIANQSRSAVSAIRKIDQVAGQSAACAQDVTMYTTNQSTSMEDIVSSATVLSTMAEQLKELTGQFRV
jgi:methyl-accepting chemotaxis protein